MNSLLNKISMGVDSDAVTALSIDLFDTLLLRNTKPELYRFYEVALLHQKYFSKYNIHKDVDSLFCARLLAHKTGYKTAPLIKKCRDSSLNHILTLYLVSLQLAPATSTIETLISLEMEYEKHNLNINKPLYQIIKNFANLKRKIFVISDMYFDYEQILALLDHFQLKHLITRVYVSSDYSVSKICGELFTTFLDSENLQPTQVIHVGDSYLADKLIPESKGIMAVHTPPPFFKRSVRYIRKMIVRYRYRRYLP